MTKTINKASESLSGAMAKLYKIGGLMLVFVFVGTLTMAGGNFFGGDHSGIIVAVGALVTLTCLSLFAMAQVQAARSSQQFRGFSDVVTGHWWERITPDDGSALSFVWIETDPLTGTVRMGGDAF